jgi:TetR/AcrR family transcriptional regulator, cholesterol catabolism regulator
MPVTESTRDRIVRAAEGLFAQHGYHGASMRDIAAGTGLRAASLYNHFPSKEELLLAVGSRYFDAMLPALRSIASRADDPLDRLVDMIRTTIDIGLAHKDAHLTLVSDMRIIRKTPQLAPLVDASRACIAQWRRVLREGRRTGVIRADIQPAAAIWIIFTAMTGMIDDDYRADMLGAPNVRPVPALCTLLVDGLRASA